MFVQRQRLLTLIVPSSLVLCDSSPAPKIGSKQYVANKFIEDRIHHQHINNKIQYILVLDGHGGPQAAEYMTKQLPALFQSHIESGQSISRSMTTSFLEADSMWFNKVKPVYDLGFTNPIKVGACAVAIAMDESSIVVASVGDCKAVLARKNGNVLDLNIQRNANLEEEQDRLRKLHPNEDDVVKCKRSWEEKIQTGTFWSKKEEIKTFYSGCYVKGRLQPTKSFGDFHLKHQHVHFDPERNRPFLDPSTPKSFPYIDADPDITVTLRTKDDSFLIAATDGLWDQFTSAEAVGIVRAGLKAGLSPEQAADELVEAALMRAATNCQMSLKEMKLVAPGSRRSLHDDISVCIVQLG